MCEWLLTTLSDLDFIFRLGAFRSVPRLLDRLLRGRWRPSDPLIQLFLQRPASDPPKVRRRLHLPDLQERPRLHAARAARMRVGLAVRAHIVLAHRVQHRAGHQAVERVDLRDALHPVEVLEVLGPHEAVGRALARRHVPAVPVLALRVAVPDVIGGARAQAGRNEDPLLLGRLDQLGCRGGRRGARRGARRRARFFGHGERRGMEETLRALIGFIS